MTTGERVRAWLGRRMLKALKLTILPGWMRHNFIETTFRALTREGFKANSAVFACVSTLAFAFIEPKLRVYEETENGRHWVKHHPLNQLFKHPNAQMGMLEFLLFIIIYLAIGGNAYVYKGNKC